MEVSKSIQITDELVINFAKLSGDNNPIHLDEDYAKNSIFGKRIAHGMLLGSFFSTLIAEEYPGPGSIYLNQTLNFKKPCFIGDVIKVIVSLDKQEDKKYFLNTIILNSSQEVIIEGTSLVLKN
jgi:3-hydroxybutyryl-CoA dehydratase